ncbi:MAG: hypothetical protein IPG59_12975 [Candidatus Melainabacteria bacterium]|nr:MAG: hypothetical protein IPG59_12975 [Candidatus Melainabacteria bacterium]
MGNSEEKSSSSDGSDCNANSEKETTVNQGTPVTEGEEAAIPMLDLDWTLEGLSQNPAKGIEEALAENIALMEEQTRRLIEFGTVEDIMRALDYNHKQMQAIQLHIQSLAEEIQTGA